MVDKDVEKKFGDKVVGDYTELVYECAICKRTYKNPGMCMVCNAVLKPRGE